MLETHQKWIDDFPSKCPLKKGLSQLAMFDYWRVGNIAECFF
jgi:hypothetical protein